MKIAIYSILTVVTLTTAGFANDRCSSGAGEQESSDTKPADAKDNVNQSTDPKDQLNK